MNCPTCKSTKVGGRTICSNSFHLPVPYAKQMKKDYSSLSNRRLKAFLRITQRKINELKKVIDDHPEWKDGGEYDQIAYADCVAGLNRQENKLRTLLDLEAERQIFK